MHISYVVREPGGASWIDVTHLEDNSDPSEITIISFLISIPLRCFGFLVQEAKATSCVPRVVEREMKGLVQWLWFKTCKQTLFPRVITLRSCLGIKVLSIKYTHRHTQGPTSADLHQGFTTVTVCVENWTSQSNLCISPKWPLRAWFHGKCYAAVRESAKFWLVYKKKKRGRQATTDCFSGSVQMSGPHVQLQLPPSSFSYCTFSVVTVEISEFISEHKLMCSVSLSVMKSGRDTTNTQFPRWKH